MALVQYVQVIDNVVMAILVVWNTKCYLTTESKFGNRGIVTLYVNNKIPKALVLRTLTPNVDSFLSIPIVGNPILLSDAKCYLNTESLRDSSNLFSSI